MSSFKSIGGFFAMAALLTFNGRADAQPFYWADTNYSVTVTPQMAAYGSRGIHVHDPSAIIKCGDEYWVFYTGYGIPSYHSKDLTTWERGPSVFTNPPAWAEHAIPQNRWMRYWAPDVIHIGDRYLLYYAVSVFGKKTSAIGLVTNPTLNPDDPKYHWTDEGMVIRTETTNNFNAIDPAASKDANGNLWLSLGSFWTGVKLVQLDPNTGKRVATNSEIYSIAFNDSIEASYLYHHDDYYYLFVNWGKCCLGTNSTYEVRVGRSHEITGDYLDKAGEPMMTGGGSYFLGSHGPFIGPGQVGIISLGGTNLLSCHFYDGTRHGFPTLAILPLTWDTNGWPKVSLP
ncbi:MAG TPA: arabinan endo-1,5-alpha-L-arabinosidase [Pseudomonadales bacterium]|nr:arabinan endo-1,5-alpha-L-arabinosidase [Pseudomonadales bacterium]